MFTIVLIVHSWLRWVALATGIAATAAALGSGRADASSRADRFGLLFMMALDVQMLLGLMLYLALSPLTTQMLQNLGEAMRDPLQRFWAVDHVATMFLAVILAHVGRVLARKARTPESKRTRQLVCFGLATLLMLVAIPWPGLSNGRPLFRF